MYKNKLLTIILVAFLVMAVGCGPEDVLEENISLGSVSEADDAEPAVRKVEIIVKGHGSMIFELYEADAPDTVANFIELANDKFYDGIVFHRIIQDFMVQGGDPTGTGMGGSETTIKGEFSANGFEGNSLSHEVGAISMARSQDMDSASSQFFIVTGDATFLDGQYAAFGQLVEGMDVLEAIAATPVEASSLTGEVSSPTEAVVIETVNVLE